MTKQSRIAPVPRAHWRKQTTQRRQAARARLQHGPESRIAALLSVLYRASPSLEPHLDADGAGLVPAQQLLGVRREVVEGRVARPAEVVPVVRLVRRAPGSGQGSGRVRVRAGSGLGSGPGSGSE